MQNKGPVKLFHVPTASYSYIIALLQKHLHQKPLEELIAIYSSAGGFSVLSADEEVCAVLTSDSGQELRQNSLLYYALSKEPQTFQFYYGNQELVNELQLS